jgi:hypothetical protein
MISSGSPVQQDGFHRDTKLRVSTPETPLGSFCRNVPAIRPGTLTMGIAQPSRHLDTKVMNSRAVTARYGIAEI